MGEKEIVTDGGQREEREVAEKIDRKLAPIRELINNGMLRLYPGSSHSYDVTVEWSEPPEQGQGDWTKHKASGPLDENFLAWAEEHYGYWYRHGELHDVVSLRVVKIGESDEFKRERSW